MDYKKHYDALIDRARQHTVGGPKESHHVVPRCLGGSDGKTNRVNLTPEEHYVAHQLLVKIYPGNAGLLVAALLMSRDNRNGKRSNNKLYGWLRRRASEAQSIARAGIPLSVETRARISEVLKASPAARAAADQRIGVPRADAVREKVSTSHKNSELAKAARALLFARKIGIPRSTETKAKLSAAHTGKKSAPHSEETKKKIRDAAIGRKMSAETIAKMVGSKTPEQRRAAALKAWQTKRAKAAQI